MEPSAVLRRRSRDPLSASQGYSMATTNVCMYTPVLGDDGAAGRLAVPVPRARY